MLESQYALRCLAGAGKVVLVVATLDPLISLFTISNHVVIQARKYTWWASTYNIVAISIAMGLLGPIGIAIIA